MPKRSNPFVEDFIPQRKIHVGVKQFNNNENKLQKVYEKTLQLLYKGAKKLPVKDPSDTIEAVSNIKKDGMKQLFIANDGKLLQSGNMVQNNSLPFPQCGCGTRTDQSYCAYCEVRLCTLCMHTCTRCGQSYCHKCSLVGSEASAVCVSCYS